MCHERVKLIYLLHRLMKEVANALIEMAFFLHLENVAKLRLTTIQLKRIVLLLSPCGPNLNLFCFPFFHQYRAAEAHENYVNVGAESKPAEEAKPSKLRGSL